MVVQAEESLLLILSILIQKYTESSFSISEERESRNRKSNTPRRCEATERKLKGSTADLRENTTWDLGKSPCCFASPDEAVVKV